MTTKKIYCFAGKVPVTIGDTFNWDGAYPGRYKVKRWGQASGMYSPSGIGGTISVWVENEKGEEIEWCGDSVAHGVFMTKNPDYFKP
jgi:hypothetical protein